jgi:hypothetical protein
MKAFGEAFLHASVSGNSRDRKKLMKSMMYIQIEFLSWLKVFSFAIGVALDIMPPLAMGLTTVAMMLPLSKSAYLA